MGYYKTTTVVNKSITIPDNTYTHADDFVQFVKKVLVGVTDITDPEHLIYPGVEWTGDQVSATISFAALAIVPHVLFTLAGVKYEIVDHDAPVHGGIPVQYGGDNNSTLAALGAAVQGGSLEWDFSIPGPGTITFIKTTNPVMENNLVCSIFPSGSVGIWSNTTGVAGEGFTFNGGWNLTSKYVNSNPIVVKIITLGNGASIIISDDLSTKTFQDLQIRSNSWTIIGDRYQFMLVSTNDFLIASHLMPLGNSIYFNFITSPGGARNSLSNINLQYYVDWNGARYGANLGVGVAPALCFPGFGSGISPVDKLANNIVGLDIVRDDSTQQPYEAFLSCMASRPSGANGIRGAFWNSLIYPTYAVNDAPVDINGRPGIVILGQPGLTSSSRGIFVARTS